MRADERHIVKKVVGVSMAIPFIIFIYSQTILSLYNPYLEFSFLERFLMGSVKNIFLIVFVACATPCVAIIGFFLLPVKKALNDESLIPLAKKRIIRLPILLLIVYFIGFLSGPIVAYITPSSVKLNDFIYVFMVSFCSGLFCVSFTLFYIDKLMLPVKKLYNMQKIKDDQKELSIYFKYILSMASVFLLIWSVTQYIGFYYIQKGGEADTGVFFTNVFVNNLIIFIAGILQFILINNNVKDTINDIRGTLKSIIEGNGDLTKRITVSSFNEFGLLTSDFNDLIVFLDEMVGKIKKVAAQIDGSKGILTNSIEGNKRVFEGVVASVNKIIESINQDYQNTKLLQTISDKVVDNSRLINDAVKKQKEAVQYSGASIEEMTANIRSVSNLSQSATKDFRAILQDIEIGKESLKNSINSINQIYDASKDLSSLINTISDISERVKLLAINASIEAARAGKAGEGFAVVAQEVRKLSEASGASVKGIDSKLTEINDMIFEGAEMINKSGKTIEVFFENTEKSIVMINEINQSMIEQELGTKTIEKSSVEVQENNYRLTELSKSGETLMDEMKKILENYYVSSQNIHLQTEEQKGKNQHLVEINRDLVNAANSINSSFDDLKDLLHKFIISEDIEAI
ncbi:MAG TPA: methyl-accepting chemotaxis protein [Spirochaetota bacterium]|nr:methyl-accepting chemotaxis protein [Spirochaetota bacterium]HOS31996.1 methyl-accepting chemotaxis protein [Spirochaetota bacterium]HOS55234.1 methyl-accepting chemotaxis protein [Spirochaetota bacterium]HPK61149.1 methyl-accepting chemotaxis protein [Spirochaetota bacterium]HQF77763.1 methyl-accepting chemotaxis protein [Spirochaetota bacterium]